MRVEYRVGGYWLCVVGVLYVVVVLVVYGLFFVGLTGWANR